MGNKTANDNIFNYDITVRAMTELISILTTEIDFIKSNSTKSLASTFDRKVDIVKYLETQNHTLAANPQINEQLSSAEKDNLKKLAQELQSIVAENSKELEKAKYFNEMMIKSIVEAVATKTKTLNNYDANGYSSKKVKSSHGSLALSEDI